MKTIWYYALMISFSLGGICVYFLAKYHGVQSIFMELLTINMIFSNLSSKIFFGISKKFKDEIKELKEEMSKKHNTIEEQNILIQEYELKMEGMEA